MDARCRDILWPRRSRSWQGVSVWLMAMIGSVGLIGCRSTPPSSNDLGAATWQSRLPGEDASARAANSSQDFNQHSELEAELAASGTVTQASHKQAINEQREAHIEAAQYDVESPSIEFPNRLDGEHSLEVYLEMALGRNPTVQAALLQHQSLSYKVPVASSLPDPKLSITAQPAPVQTASGEQQLILAAQQTLPWKGKQRGRAGVAAATASVARSQLTISERETVRDVKQTYFELYYLQRALVTLAEERKLLEEIRTVAETRYRAAQTSQQDVLRATLEVTSIAREQLELEQRLASSQARMTQLLNAVPQSRPLAASELTEPPPLPELELLQSLAMDRRPELEAKRSEWRRDRQSAGLARLDYRPDVTVGVSWIDVKDRGISPVANGQDALLVTAGVNLPIYRNRLNAAARSADAQASATALELEAMRAETTEQIGDLFAQASYQRETLDLYRTEMVPLAKQTLDVSVRAYQTGEADFLTLIENWRKLLDHELATHRIEASLHQTLATIEQMVGAIEPSLEQIQRENIEPISVGSELVDPKTSLRRSF